MWLFLFGASLQVIVISECLLRRCVQVFLVGNKTDLKQYADAHALGTFSAQLFNIISMPLQVLAAFVAWMLQNIFLFTAVLFLAVILISFADNQRSGMAMFFNTYWQGF